VEISHTKQKNLQSQQHQQYQQQYQQKQQHHQQQQQQQQPNGEGPAAIQITRTIRRWEKRIAKINDT